MKRGAGIFFTNGQKVLLLKRCKNDRFAHQWCLPGGKVEKNETELQAARRECEEECGTCPGNNVAEISHTHGEFKWTSFFFKVDDIFTCNLNKEHDDWKWVDIDDLPNQALMRPFRQNIERYIEKAKNIK